MIGREVTLKIRFLSDCLGAVRRPDRSCMVRDPSGKVMFMPTWWSAIIRFAAGVRSKHQGLVKKIEWDPVVVGSTSLFRRYYETDRYAVHEAFCRGDSIEVHCVLPDGLSLDDFRELAEVAGKYKGISPYRHDKKFGLFEVVSVRPRTGEAKASI